MNNETQKIKSIIEERLVKRDKNGNEFLILNLANGKSIFCFPSQEINLDDLFESQEYDFTVREGRKQDQYVLVDFKTIE